MYVATRGLYSLKPPTIFVPSCIQEDVEKLFDLHRSMSQVDLEFDLVALDMGMSSFFDNLLKLISMANESCQLTHKFGSR